MKWGLFREEVRVLKSHRTLVGPGWKEASSSKEPSVQLVGIKVGGGEAVNGWGRGCVRSL